MEIKVLPTGLKDIEALRILFLQENHFQFVHNKCHLYGWADCYACIADGTKVGYGAVWGQSKTEAHDRADDCAYVLQYNNEVAATGGLMLNYNMPYADIYYEVNENYRQKGLGTLMVQELKKAAYEMGRVPAARCNIRNIISKYTLLKAGFTVCGCILKGNIQ